MKPIYLKIFIIAAFISLACTTKVSEWVLLNAPADRYMLVYYHSEAINDMQKQQNLQIEKRIKTANVIFRAVQKSDVKNPFYALSYKNRLIAEYKDYNSLKNIATSFTRQRVAAELMAGKLCVMLYLKSGNQEKDDPGLQEVKKSISASPFGSIISLVELDRTDVAEKDFVNMLLHVESDLLEIHEPMLFGVFGRFRVLEPLLAQGISDENISLMIDFFTADCSCVIKDDLPGISILHQATWANPTPALVNAIIDNNPNLLHH